MQVVGVSTFVTQSRSASLMASLSVREPESPAHLRAEQLHAEDVEALARTSSDPM
jgi:hypothetical protein